MCHTLRQYVQDQGLAMEQKVDTQPAVGKRGVQRYKSNPFIGATIANTRSGSKKLYDTTGHKMMVVSGETGEILAPAGFWQYQEVDKTQFVKLYINGVKAFKDLTNAGAKVFELLYIRLQENIGKDQILMSYPSVDQELTPIGRTTFYKGVTELVAKGFVAESVVPGVFYVNPDYLWNGDRLAFVKEYRKGASPKSPPRIDPRQTDLLDHLDEQSANEKSDSRTE